jgi:TolB-like protein
MDLIAVPQFANLPRDFTQEYFADGTRDELITKRSAIGSLRIPWCRSVMLYKGVNKPLREFATELKVEGGGGPGVMHVGEQRPHWRQADRRRE